MMTGCKLTEIYGRSHGLALNPVETELVDDDDQEGALSRTVTAVSHCFQLDLSLGRGSQIRKGRHRRGTGRDPRGRS
jgi:hypothetical protein